MEVRQLLRGDAEVLIELFDAVMSDFAGSMVDPSGPAAFVDDPMSFAFGAWFDGEPAGLAWGMFMRAPSGRVVTYLHQLDVRPRFRRRGVGTRLVLESMALARNRGSTRFWLSTGGHNETAQALYESLGGDRKPDGDVNYWWELEPPV